MDGRTDKNHETLLVLYFFQRKITVKLVARVDELLVLLERIGLAGLYGL